MTPPYERCRLNPHSHMFHESWKCDCRDRKQCPYEPGPNPIWPLLAGSGAGLVLVAVLAWVAQWL